MDIAARILNFSLMIGLPVALAVYLAKQHRAEWRLFGIGVLTFLLSQVLHIPFNSWVLSPLMGKLGFSIDQQGLQLVWIGLFYGLSAGIFEETVRYLGYRWWIKDDRDWKSALMFGTGHGGIEAILLGLLVLWGFIQAVSLRGTDLSLNLAPDQLEIARAQLQAYWDAPWHMALLGAVERMAAIPVHLSAAVLVLQSFRRTNILWLLLAILWHTLVDAVAVYASQTWSIYVTEGIILVFGILGVVLIFLLKSTDADKNGAGEDPLPEMPEIRPAAPTNEDLENSRYA